MVYPDAACRTLGPSRLASWQTPGHRGAGGSRGRAEAERGAAADVAGGTSRSPVPGARVRPRAARGQGQGRRASRPHNPHTAGGGPGAGAGCSADPHHRQHASRAVGVHLQDPGGRSRPGEDQDGLLSVHKPRRRAGGCSGRGDHRSGLRPSGKVDHRGVPRPGRTGRLHRGGLTVDHCNASHRASQTKLCGYPRASGGQVDARHSQAGLPGGGRGCAGLALARRDTEGAAGVASRTGLDPQPRGHIGNAGRLW